MVQRLSDTLARQIDTHDPFMQIHKIGQKYNDLVDAYNDLEAELEAIKNPTDDEDDQQTDDQSADEIPADNDDQSTDEDTEVADEEEDAE